MDKRFKGLTESQVQESQQKYGSNKLPEKRVETFWEKFVGALDDPMLKLLMVISAIFIVMFLQDMVKFMIPLERSLPSSLLLQSLQKQKLQVIKPIKN